MNLFKQAIADIARSELSKLDRLYQKHAGEECYIFGDGISLKWMDLHRFTDRDAIISPMAILHRETHALRARYCALIEPFLFYPLTPVIGNGNFRFVRLAFQKEHRKAMREYPATTFFVNLSNYPVVHRANSIFVSRWHKPPFAHSNPFRDRADAHAGSLRFELSLAIFLGYRKAYLVGHDYTHFPSRSLHFYEKGEGVVGEHRRFSGDFIEYARQSIDLVTVTLEGGSETMPSMTYETLTGCRPAFRENTELVDLDKLETLARWPGYSIF